jgi:hypothetical protein
MMQNVKLGAVTILYACCVLQALLSQTAVIKRN